MKLVYIASPLKAATKEAYEDNIFKAVLYSKWASMHEDVLPLAPHTLFTQYLDDSDEADRKKGIEMSLGLLHRCDEVWVFGDSISEGMRKEIDTALNNDIRVRFISDNEVFDKGVCL